MKIRQKRYGMDTNILKYKMYLRILMVLCTKQHLRKIWSSIHEKVKPEAELTKKLLINNKRVLNMTRINGALSGLDNFWHLKVI